MTLSTITFAKCDVPPATFERRTGVEQQIPGIRESGIPFDRFETIPPVPPGGKDYWPVVLLDGEPVSPEAAVSALVRRVAILPDRETAHEVCNWLQHAAHLKTLTVGFLAVGHEVNRYSAVYATAARVQRADEIARVMEAIGMTETGDPNSHPIYFTSEELAVLLRVDERSIQRWAGNKLPAAIKIGRRWLFKVDAVLNLLSKGAHDVPADPLEDQAAA